MLSPPSSVRQMVYTFRGDAVVTFLDRLKRACETHQSLLCVGLDPDPAQMPVQDLLQFNRTIIDATADLVCAYKPNLAFYEALGLAGLEALKGTVEHINQMAPDVLVIGDGKRGDIGSSSRAYAQAMFQVWGFDAITVNPYMGNDSLDPFFEYTDKGVFVLCRTSNPGAVQFQDLKVVGEAEERQLYQHVAMRALEWNTHGNVGLVVGATYSGELHQVRKLCARMPILIPGVGAQGGDLEAAVRYGTDERGRLAIINSSRQVLYASRGEDFPQAARREAIRLRDEINRILEVEGRGWS